MAAQPHDWRNTLVRWWLERVAEAVPLDVLLSESDWDSLAAQLSSIDDPYVRGLLDVAVQAPLDVQDEDHDGVVAQVESLRGTSDRMVDGDIAPSPVLPGTTVVRARRVWQCSGWRGGGDPTFLTPSPTGVGEVGLTSWDDEGRVVRGDGTERVVWRRDTDLLDTGCGQLSGLVWVTASGGAAPQPLLDAVAAVGAGDATAPIVLQLGGAATGVARGAAYVSKEALEWGEEAGRWDVLAALVVELVEAAEADTGVEEQRLNEELVVRFGSGLPTFAIGAP
jgi:hypothetical protein